MGWSGDNGDPDNFLATLLGCEAVGSGNSAQWCNEEFNDLVTEAAQVTDQDERAALYEEAQVVFKDQAPWATIAHSTVFTPYRSEVTDFELDSLGFLVFGQYGLSQ